VASRHAGRPVTQGRTLELADTFWAEGDSILASYSLEETIRIAYAAERCIQALLEKNDARTLRTSKRLGSFEFSDWLPRIMALHHPAASQLQPVTFLQLQSQVLFGGPMPRTRNSDLLICNFVLSYTFLAQLKKTVSMEGSQENHVCIRAVGGQVYIRVRTKNKAGRVLSLERK
jgi:hypothetical protein